MRGTKQVSSMVQISTQIGQIVAPKISGIVSLIRINRLLSPRLLQRIDQNLERSSSDQSFNVSSKMMSDGLNNQNLRSSRRYGSISVSSESSLQMIRS
ncbi:hypothetical protein AVEN_228614-1 [Araneus ventricosus]|uniref:Uncharacterized protein n=1 Tax=Araneus ventricosus TaxID=182803 RepID=A0A4Y2T981_ARAVE|nr:hypothetical protein AVEN_228614-1 [Araneus ventricosus]